MPSVVNGDLCIKCGTCAGVCPVEAFHVCDEQYVVDPDAYAFRNARKAQLRLMTKRKKNGLR